jgi:hypothetical protein
MHEKTAKVMVFFYNRLFDPLIQGNFLVFIEYYLKQEPGRYRFHLVTYENSLLPLTPAQQTTVAEMKRQGLEYLASGRAVLATRTLDYEDRRDLVEMATDRADYAQRFAAIMAKPAVWNSPARVAARRVFASENTYPRQIDRIVQALGPRGALIS